MSTAIKFENISKQYRLGLVSTQTLSHDLNRWWTTNIRGKEDPYLKIGEVNDRATKGTSDYVWALKDIDFEVQQGDVLGIIGKNGAGKSTLLKILSKVTAPTTGTIKAAGRIASLLEVGTGFHPEMTGRENIFMNGAIMGMTKAEINRKFDEIVDFSGVERYIDTPAKRYSSGMTVRLGFAIAAHLDPEILVVDEVLAVGDAEFQKKAIGKMQDVSKGEGRTVLFVSHNMAAVKSLCNKGVILENGNTIFEGSADDSISLYMAQNIAELITETIITVKNRRYDVSKEVEFVSAKLMNESELLATDEPLKFELILKKNKNIEIISIESMIDNQRDERVGTFISKMINIAEYKNEFKVILTLPGHNLAKGRYKVNFNVGLKDLHVGLKDYDVVYNVLSFEICYSDYLKKTPIVLWRDNWGNCNFQEGSVKISSVHNKNL
jgi:lipopolysaccharide transport system ATP-binding protein